MQAEETFNIDQVQDVGLATTFFYTFLKFKHITCKEVSLEKVEEVKNRTFIFFTMRDSDYKIVLYKVVLYEDKRGIRKFYIKPTLQDIKDTPKGYRCEGYGAAYNKPILIFGGEKSLRKQN